jgi:hypothetical protein
MTGARFFALFFAACALLASALVAIPLDSSETPDYTGNIPAATAPYRLTGTSSAGPAPRPAPEQSEAALPRLWLGSPVAR